MILRPRCPLLARHHLLWRCVLASLGLLSFVFFYNLRVAFNDDIFEHNVLIRTDALPKQHEQHEAEGELEDIVINPLSTSTLLEDAWYKYVVLKIDASDRREGKPSWLDFFRGLPPRYDSMLTEAEIYHLRRLGRLGEVIDSSLDVNDYPFEYIFLNPDVCGKLGGKGVFLLIYVYSAPGNLARRTVIRSTWGDPKYYLPRVMRLVFILGLPEPGRRGLARALTAESAAHRDIVLSSFVDNAANRTYKAMSALLWVWRHCDRSQYVLKTDDDVVVNAFALATYLPAKAPGINLIICRVVEKRSVAHARYVDRAHPLEYASDHYPPYCSGPAYVMTATAAVALITTSTRVKYLKAEDPYITGVLPFISNDVTFVQTASRYMLYETATEEEVAEKLAGRTWHGYFFGQIRDLDVFRITWMRMTLLAAKCRGSIC